MTEPAKPRAKPKDRLAWLLKRHHIQPEHMDLGESIIDLYEDKIREAAPHMHFGQGSDRGVVGSVMRRLTARQRWDRLFRVGGATAEALVSCIIVEGLPLGDAAKTLNLHPKAVLPMLRLSLDVLGRS